MQHIGQITIHTFRGIQNMTINDFGDLNILVGDNNSGKTTLLEALMLLSGPADVANLTQISRLRERYNFMGKSSLNFFDSFLYLFDRTRDSDYEISLSGMVHDRNISILVHGEMTQLLVDAEELVNQSMGYMRNRLREEVLLNGDQIEGFSGTFTYSDGVQEKSQDVFFHKYTRNVNINKNNGSVPVRFISTIDHIVNNSFRTLIRNKAIKGDVIRALNIFDPDIKDLLIVQEDDFRYVQAIDHNRLGLLPISMFGDGIKRMISLAVGVIAAKNGILLIDEVETSIHKKAMKAVFSWLLEACHRFQVQLFLTTHSEEAMDEILNSRRDIDVDGYEARVVTLVKKENGTVARVLTSEKARQVRVDYDLELRS